MLGRIAGVAVMTALFTSVAAPALASTPEAKPSSPFSTRAVAKAVTASTPVVAAATPATPNAPAPAKQSSGDSFFKSRTGVLMIAVFAVGTGYAIYSAREDRIRGLNR